jgi:hypothetical protein
MEPVCISSCCHEKSTNGAGNYSLSSPSRVTSSNIVPPDKTFGGGVVKSWSFLGTWRDRASLAFRPYRRSFTVYFPSMIRCGSWFEHKTWFSRLDLRRINSFLSSIMLQPHPFDCLWCYRFTMPGAKFIAYNLSELDYLERHGVRVAAMHTRNELEE